MNGNKNPNTTPISAAAARIKAGAVYSTRLNEIIDNAFATIHEAIEQGRFACCIEAIPDGYVESLIETLQHHDYVLTQAGRKTDQRGLVLHIEW